jgi:hypothetical protein
MLHLCPREIDRVGLSMLLSLVDCLLLLPAILSLMVAEVTCELLIERTNAALYRCCL